MMTNSFMTKKKLLVATKNLNNTKPTIKIKLLSLSGIILMVFIDQLIKYFVDLLLKPVGSVIIIPKVLSLTYLENDGAMLGMMGGKTLFMTVAAVICILVIMFVIFSGKVKFGIDYCCIVFMAAGGLGNIIDRIRLGYVIDYIEFLFVDFYIFNFADCLVTFAAFLMIANQIVQIKKESQNKKEKKQNG